METIEAIMKRRSIRRFSDRQISKEDLMTIIQAGRYAPDSYHKQAVHITAIHSPEKLKELEAIMKEIVANMPIDPETAFFKDRWVENGSRLCYDAPTFIIVSVAPNSKFPEMDCAVCLENMLIAATGLGISSCFINTLFKLIPLGTIKEVMANFGVPDTHTIHCAAAMGYGAVIPEAPKRNGENITVIE